MRVRMRRHQHDAVALVRQDDVVDKVAAPGDETLVLDPADRLANTELVDGHIHRSLNAPGSLE
jgi:hypothetical protein